MTRNGKIARLPREIRAQLNRRLSDGGRGNTILEWLNHQKEVKDVLKEQFGGRLISKQNLSEWKKGGYVEWMRDEETCNRVSRLAERADDLQFAAGENADISDLLSHVLAAELADATARLSAIADPQEYWKRFREILRELARLRHEDHRAQHIQLERERWEEHLDRQEDADDKAHLKEFKDRARDVLMSPMKNAVTAEGFGGGKHGKRMAEILHIINTSQSIEEIADSVKNLPPLPNPVKPGQSESKSVQPSQTESNLQELKNNEPTLEP